MATASTKSITEFLKGLPDSELLQAYEELIRWERTGVLPNGVIKRIYSLLDKKPPLTTLANKFLQEMGRRYYEMIMHPPQEDDEDEEVRALLRFVLQGPPDAPENGTD